MNSFRAFIAIEIPPDLQAKLEQLSKCLQGLISLRVIRWTPAHNSHITLKFLGDVPAPQVEKISDLLRLEAARMTVFDASIGGLGVFPSIKKPRVIWTGIDAPSDLMAIQKSVEKGAAELGFTPEERAFTPHLTLGRLVQNASPEEIRLVGNRLLAELVSTHSPMLGTFQARAITLFRSDLQPGGAVYTRIASFLFTGIPS